MKSNRIGRLMFASLVAAIVLTGTSAVSNAADKVRFLLDWYIQGNSAVFVNAVDGGGFASLGLDVTLDRGYGSADAISKLASGTYDIAFGDINSMIEFNADHPDKPPLIAIMMVYDRPPFSILTFDPSMRTPKDLEGKRLLSSPGDANLRMLPLFGKLAGFDASKIKIVTIQPQLREQLLLKGAGDACTGFYYVSYMNFKALGTDMKKLKAFMYDDYGIEVYGDAIITTKAYANAHPDVLKRFLLGIARSMREVVDSPSAKFMPLIKQRNPVINEAIEAERLEIVNRQNIVTPYVLKNGFGDIDKTRMRKAIEQLKSAFHLATMPKLEDVFTDVYLPPRQERMLRLPVGQDGALQ
jgi:NitT/TauT family transport system substrate-binding protein